MIEHLMGYKVVFPSEAIFTLKFSFLATSDRIQSSKVKLAEFKTCGTNFYIIRLWKKDKQWGLIRWLHLLSESVEIQ